MLSNRNEPATLSVISIFNIRKAEYDQESEKSHQEHLELGTFLCYCVQWLWYFDIPCSVLGVGTSTVVINGATLARLVCHVEAGLVGAVPLQADVL